MATTKTLKELALSRGPAFDGYATPENRAALLKATRESHNGAYSNTLNSQAMRRAEYIETLLTGSVEPSNTKTSASLKALKTFLETYQLEFKKMARYWNGTAGSAYPRVWVGETVTPLYCQQVWTLSERFSHKVGQIWGLESKANPKLEKLYPLNPVTPKVEAPKAEVKPAPKVEAPKPQPKPVAPKAEPAKDFKAIIKAMKSAGVSADLILKTLESL
jgi:hypothetical protein